MPVIRLRQEIIIQKEISDSIDKIKTSPFSDPNVKKLKPPLNDYYRCRTGDYRIIFAVSVREQRVYVDYIKHRREAYR